MALGVGVGLMASVLATEGWLGVTGSHDTRSVGALVAGVIGLWVGFVGVPLLASRSKGAGRLSVDFGLRARPLDLPLGVGAGLLGQAVVAGVVVALRQVVGRNEPSQQVLDTTRHAHGASHVLVALIVVVAVPVAEELFFRGLILRALERRAGRVVAVVVSAIAFGVAHLDGSQGAATGLTLFAALAAFGVLQALLAEATGRLGPGIVSHATFNAFTLVMAAIGFG
ncbi:MAG: CPBP family intramembrane glutamic endopeptidase [Acidimicrobiales bacterium]